MDDKTLNIIKCTITENKEIKKSFLKDLKKQWKNGKITISELEDVLDNLFEIEESLCVEMLLTGKIDVYSTGGGFYTAQYTLPNKELYYTVNSDYKECLNFYNKNDEMIYSHNKNDLSLSDSIVYKYLLSELKEHITL